LAVDDVFAAVAEDFEAVNIDVVLTVDDVVVVVILDVPNVLPVVVVVVAIDVLVIAGLVLVFVAGAVAIVLEDMFLAGEEATAPGGLPSTELVGEEDGSAFAPIFSEEPLLLEVSCFFEYMSLTLLRVITSSLFVRTCIREAAYSASALDLNATKACDFVIESHPGL